MPPRGMSSRVTTGVSARIAGRLGTDRRLALCPARRSTVTTAGCRLAPDILGDRASCQASDLRMMAARASRARRLRTAKRNWDGPEVENTRLPGRSSTSDRPLTSALHLHDFIHGHHVVV